jgi:hypothetical protein
MRKFALLFLVLILASSTAFAAPFAPPVMTLSADAEIQYDFDGTELQIPVTVSGTSASPLFFLVHTKGIASTVPNMRSGYLGWHHVCKIDTCVYLSPPYNFTTGEDIVTWDGKDDDGGAVPAGEYTYYMFAIDSVTPKYKACQFLSLYGTRRMWFQKYDEQGVAMSNPWWCQKHTPTGRWPLGADPLDESALIETFYNDVENRRPTGFERPHTDIDIRPEGFNRDHIGIALNDPTDFDYFYTHEGNDDTEVEAIMKWKFVPGGTAIWDTDFGEDGFGCIMSGTVGYLPGVVTDGTYIYTTDNNQKVNTEADSYMYMCDWDGTMIEEFDLRPWFSRPEEYAQGKAMNGGPDTIRERNGYLAIACYCSCTKQVCDPARYLESGDYEDMFLYTNLNGDYILDQNFEETAAVVWACNYPVTGYHYTFDVDINLFSHASAYDHGAVSFGLIGPDGTGIGWVSFAGETGGWKKGSIFLDTGSAFDGMYCDNEQAGGTHYQEGGWQPNEFTAGLWWVGYDSINGIISNVVGVADDAPEAVDAISVAQNAPNPFNPTTTINFSLADAGNTTVDVYNVAGQKVDTIVNEYMESGSHSAVWDATEFSAGVYFCTVKSQGHSKTIKMTLVK